MEINIVNLKEMSKKNRMDSEYFSPKLIKEESSLKNGGLLSDFFVASKSKFDKKNFQSDFFNYLEISDVDIFTGNYKTNRFKIDSAPSRAQNIANKNSVVISTVRPYRSAAALIQNDCVCSSGFLVFNPIGDISPEELFLFFKSKYFKKQIARRTRATMYPAADLIDFNELIIPRTTKKFGEKIVLNVQTIYDIETEIRKLNKDILDKITKFFDNIFGDKIKKSFNKYSVSHIKLDQLFNNSNRIDSEYYQKLYFEMDNKVSKSHFIIGDLFSDIYKGSTPTKSQQTEDITKYSVLKASSLGVENLNFIKKEPITKEFYKSNAIKVCNSFDILILSDAHSPEQIGKKINIIPENLLNLENVITSGELLTIRNNEINKEMAVYTYYYLRSYYGYLSIQRCVRGITSHLYPSDVKNIKVPKPDRVILNFLKLKNEQIMKLNIRRNFIISNLISEYDQIFE